MKHTNNILQITKSPIRTAIAVLSALLIIISALSYKYYSQSFIENLLVEAHGIIFDIIVFGILVLWLDQRRAHNINISDIRDTIDALKSWRSPESSSRILFNYSRLRKMGEKHDLSGCFLGGIQISAAVLNSSNLFACDYSGSKVFYSDFRFSYMRDSIGNGCEFDRCDFRGANLHGFSFTGCTFYNFIQLHRVRSILLDICLKF